MYAIVTPVIMGPALLILIWYENKAKEAGLFARPAAIATPAASASATTTVTKLDSEDEGDIEGKESPELAQQADQEQYEVPQLTVKEKLIKVWFEMDTLGLLLLGFGWALMLLPFSLSVNAENGYKNPSLIAMFVVGGLCLIAYCVYEALWARFPTAPIRLLKNRTFISAVVVSHHQTGGCEINLHFPLAADRLHLHGCWVYELDVPLFVCLRRDRPQHNSLEL